MIKFNEIKQNSIEKVFCENFEKLKPQPLSENQSEILQHLMLFKRSPQTKPIENKPPLFQMIEKRIQNLHTYLIDIPAMFYLTTIVKKPGDVIMYCWYFQYLSKKRNIKEFTIDEIVNIFPMGFPSENELKKVWDIQKVERPSMEYSDNLLDYKEAGKSIF